MKARIIIGANYGDEGKGTIVAKYTKLAEGRVLNILTNGGSQRGHSILTENGSVTFQHFGSGTYHGADSYYSRYFILNPMQFVKEYEELKLKPKAIYRDINCRWTTPYDSMANLIAEQLQNRKASCGMGIWNTIKRTSELESPRFGEFVAVYSTFEKMVWLGKVKNYYEKILDIPSSWKETWNSLGIVQHFINDCEVMYALTEAYDLKDLVPFYDELILENGQGLLLKDTGKDTYDTTPSDTGIRYSLELLRDISDVNDITAHYVTRPYLTRHGDGFLTDEMNRKILSKSVNEDRTNHFNEFQGEFRFGKLDINTLRDRIIDDSRGTNFELEVTHCDEMDRVKEFKKMFKTVNVCDSPLI